MSILLQWNKHTESQTLSTHSHIYSLPHWPMHFFILYFIYQFFTYNFFLYISHQPWVRHLGGHWRCKAESAEQTSGHLHFSWGESTAQNQHGTYTCHLCLFLRSSLHSPRPVTFQYLAQAGFQLLILLSVGFMGLIRQYLAQITWVSCWQWSVLLGEASEGLSDKRLFKVGHEK